jgi:hypothetical protein
MLVAHQLLDIDDISSTLWPKTVMAMVFTTNPKYRTATQQHPLSLVCPTLLRHTGSCAPCSFRLFTYEHHVIPVVIPIAAGSTASVTSNAQMSACVISFALWLR